MPSDLSVFVDTKLTKAEAIDLLISEVRKAHRPAPAAPGSEAT